MKDLTISMNIKKNIFLFGYALLVLSSCASTNPSSLPTVTFSEKAAIQLVQQTFTTFKDYPSDLLPPKSIEGEQTGSGWFLAFIQNGSGIPIISAHCFFVNNDRTVVETGQYAPLGTDRQLHISPKTCH